jgi:hypothetical protein
MNHLKAQVDRQLNQNALELSKSINNTAIWQVANGNALPALIQHFVIPRSPRTDGPKPIATSGGWPLIRHALFSQHKHCNKRWNVH